MLKKFTLKTKIEYESKNHDEINIIVTGINDAAVDVLKICSNLMNCAKLKMIISDRYVYNDLMECINNSLDNIVPNGTAENKAQAMKLIFPEIEYCHYSQYTEDTFTIGYEKIKDFEQRMNFKQWAKDREIYVI